MAIVAALKASLARIKFLYFLKIYLIMLKLLSTCFIVIASISISSAQQAAPSMEGLKVGDMAPDFTAVDQNNKTVSLKDILKNQQVILFFYRGQWCPYCNKQLMQVNDSLLAIESRGARVLAVSPETAENVGKTVAKTKASFSVLSDKKLSIMNSYGVTFALDEKTTAKYKGYGIDLTVANGENGNNLPVPATYVIGKDGKIKYVFYNKDYSKRASLKELMQNL
jgi:peroxiredoxin